MRAVLAWSAIALAALTLAVSAPARADARADATALTTSATLVFENMSAGPVAHRIPPQVLAGSYGIAIFPAAAPGRGVALAHLRDGRFSAPAFVTMTGLVGGEESIILVFNTPDAFGNILSGHFALGADVTVAAGPMKARAHKKADVYAYAESKGLFAGGAITGVAITVDDHAAAAFYGRRLGAPQLLGGIVFDLTLPAPAMTLDAALWHYAGGQMPPAR